VKGIGQRGLRCLVDELAAIVARELPQGEGEGGVDVLEGSESPAMRLIEEEIEGNPA
jgi:hypothetical protein